MHRAGIFHLLSVFCPGQLSPRLPVCLLTIPPDRAKGGRAKLPSSRCHQFPLRRDRRRQQPYFFATASSLAILMEPPSALASPVTFTVPPAFAASPATVWFSIWKTLPPLTRT